MAGLDEIYRRSIEDPSGFWSEAARAIEWDRFPTTILDDHQPPFFRWFSDGVLNTCHNAVDRHVRAGRGEQAALIHESPVTGTGGQVTYAELQEATSRFAGGLRQLGVAAGDTVIIYMPMVPEAVVAMLACARLGAVHSVVFGGFAPHELALRLDDARPKVVVSASCGVERDRVVSYKLLLDRAIAEAHHTPDYCVILQRPQGEPARLTAPSDLDFEEVASSDPVACVPVLATDPLYVLYTSGTTARPKGVVRDNGGHAVALAWSMANIYGLRPGEVFCTASYIGWVVGHSYVVYGPLLHGCTSVLYEGGAVGTPDAGAYWRVAAKHKVRVLFTTPTALRAIRQEDPRGTHLLRHRLDSLRAVFLAGESLDPDTFRWASDHLRVPVIDHWWQTETGWPVTANCLGVEPLPVKVGSANRPVPGFDVHVLDDRGVPAAAGIDGQVALRLPLPPGTLTTLWHDDGGYQSSYLNANPGYYTTGDRGHLDKDGYLFLLGRLNDVIKVANYRLSPAAIEAAIATHPDVAECAVVGIPDAAKGQVPICFVVLKTGVASDPDAVAIELVALVEDLVGPVASFRDSIVVKRLPRTRSGKILRSTMQGIAAGRALAPPATIDDPAILDEITAALRSHRLGST